MSRRLSLGNYHVGPYCGERLWRASSWRRYGLFRRTRSGFSIGPLLFWRESIKPYRVGILATSRRDVDDMARSLGLGRRDVIAFYPGCRAEGARLRALVMTPRAHLELERTRSRGGEHRGGLREAYELARRNAVMTGALS